MNRLRFVGLATAAWLVLPGLLHAQSDQVIPLRGTPINGQVVGMSATELVVEVRGSQQRIAVNEIRRVTFTDEPQELKRARDNILTGNLANGLSELRKIDVSGIERAEIRQDVQFYLAYCQGKLALTGGGDKAAAVAAMLAFVRSNSDSFHFLQAAELLGDLAVSLEKFDSALKYYSAISMKAPWPDYKLKAAILEARSMLAQGEFQAAQGKFTTVTEFSLDTPEAMRQKRIASVGRAVCMAELGNPDEAQVLLEELLLKNDANDSELFGRAYNALGLCHLKKDEPKHALQSYLFVDILFYSDPEVHAEALYHLGKLWTTVKNTERAVSARSLLADRYSGSKWAKME